MQELQKRIRHDFINYAHERCNEISIKNTKNILRFSS